MIPLTILYDEYIGRPKLTEQKKNPVEYIVPPSPLKWGSEQKVRFNKTKLSSNIEVLNEFQSTTQSSNTFSELESFPR